LSKILAELEKSKETLHSFSGKILEKDQATMVMSDIKNLLTNSVGVLGIHDETKVSAVMLAGKKASDSLRRLKSATSVDVLTSIAKDLSDDLITLTRALNSRYNGAIQLNLPYRIGFISSPHLVKQLKSSVEVLKCSSGEVIHATANYLVNPQDTSLETTRNETFKNVIEAISEGITLCIHNY
jgi:hypothetical protein